MKVRLYITVAVLFGVVLITGQEAAWADQSAACKVYEIRASKDKGGIDAELRGIRDLRQGAFKQWTRFEKLAKHSQTLKHMHAGNVSLIPGKLSILYRGAVVAAGKKPRVRLGVTIDDKKGKRLVNTKTELDAGAYLVLVEPRLRIAKGTYSLALSCASK